MRGRLLATATALADYEIVEMLLFLGIPRRDTKPQAKGLINRFGSLAGALAAGWPQLDEAGLPLRAAEAFALVLESAAWLARAERIERVVLGDWEALDRYLDPPARAQQPAGVSALLLNNRNQLLGECRFGAQDEAAAVIRTLLRQALERHATAAILVRNGAAARPAATAADRSLLAEVRGAAAAVSVQVHDMIVLGGGDWVNLGQGGGR